MNLSELKIGFVPYGHLEHPWNLRNFVYYARKRQAGARRADQEPHGAPERARTSDEEPDSDGAQARAPTTTAALAGRRGSGGVAEKGEGCDRRGARAGRRRRSRQKGRTTAEQGALAAWTGARASRQRRRRRRSGRELRPVSRAAQWAVRLRGTKVSAVESATESAIEAGAEARTPPEEDLEEEA